MGFLGKGGMGLDRGRVKNQAVITVEKLVKEQLSGICIRRNR